MQLADLNVFPSGATAKPPARTLSPSGVGTKPQQWDPRPTLQPRPTSATRVRPVLVPGKWSISMQSGE